MVHFVVTFLEPHQLVYPYTSGYEEATKGKKLIKHLKPSPERKDSAKSRDNPVEEGESLI